LGVEAEGIQWCDWGEEAFTLARKLDRPILLDLTARWCHWCHVMERTSYSDPEVIRLVNSLFIAVKVDIDRRPDLRERYNLGGFPTTAFLTDTGEVITGGTYIPKERLKSLLLEVSEQYRKDKRGAPSRFVEARAYPSTLKAGFTRVDEGIVWDIVGFVTEYFDPLYGGFGSQPKFPHPPAVELMLSMFQRMGDKGYLDVALKTLDGIRGGIYDEEEGGFFRYSVTRDWTVPHYEKMLDTNAGLLENYLHAYQLTGRPAYRATAEGIVEYVLAHLYDSEKGGFYGSQAADEEYYKLRGGERKSREAPLIDRTIYTDWCGMMAVSLLEAYAVLGEEKCLTAALKTVDFLLENNRDGGGGFYHYFDGSPHLLGLLSDQAHMARCLLKAYEATGEGRYLEAAEVLVESTVKRLADVKDGGFFDIQTTPQAIGYLRERNKPLVENAVLAESLIKLRHLTSKERYGEIAGEALAVFAEGYKHLLYLAAEYAIALEMSLHPALKMVVVGSKGEELTRGLWRECLRIFEPSKVVEVLDSDTDQEKITALGYTEAPAVYLCGPTSCSPPLKRVEEIQPAVQSFLRKAR